MGTLEDAKAGAVGRYKVIVSTIAQFRKSLSSDKSSDVRSIGSGSKSVTPRT
ncbi:hypothetical protein E4U23_003864, partial [Claviceps purpurea]